MTGVSLGTWWRTVSHLKIGQITGRLLFRIRRPVPDMRPAPNRRMLAGPWQYPARRARSLWGSKRFLFLNVEMDIAPVGWEPPEADRLWRYNLHYFDDLNSFGARSRLPEHRALLNDWIEQNRAGQGTGWEPYPTSLRLVNWIKWILSGVVPELEWLDSAAAQTRWLRRRLETHILGNHLFCNAKALVFAGQFFDGPEAEEWLSCGLDIIERELDEQILDDGGQFERSPMYHALALEDILDLINVLVALSGSESASRRLLPKLRMKAGKMFAWLRCMVHPDGQLAHFNDCAPGIAPSLDELASYGRRLGVIVDHAFESQSGLTHLASSGYVRIVKGDAVALLDVAPVGPDYLPGHAHADTLSFELSLRGRRMLVNGGTSCYGTGERRAFERGTSAHNTVEVAGENSSEVWGGFRVGRRAHPLELNIGSSRVSCAHDGYRNLKGRPRHRRSWTVGDFELLIEDEVVPIAPSEARYYLAPGMSFEADGASRWRVAAGNELLAHVYVEEGNARVASAPQAQRFGVVDDVNCLTVQLSAGRARVRWRWADHAHPVPLG